GCGGVPRGDQVASGEIEHPVATGVGGEAGVVAVGEAGRDLVDRLSGEVHLRHDRRGRRLGPGAADDVCEQVAVRREDHLPVVEITAPFDGDAGPACRDEVVIRGRVHHEGVPLLVVGAAVDRYGEAAIVRSPGEVVHVPGLAGDHE